MLGGSCGFGYQTRVCCIQVNWPKPYTISLGIILIKSKHSEKCRNCKCSVGHKAINAIQGAMKCWGLKLGLVPVMNVPQNPELTPQPQKSIVDQTIVNKSLRGSQLCYYRHLGGKYFNELYILINVDFFNQECFLRWNCWVIEYVFLGFEDAVKELYKGGHIKSLTHKCCLLINVIVLIAIYNYCGSIFGFLS